MRPESLIPKSAVATAPQRCELFVNYFTVLLTGSGSPRGSRWLFLIATLRIKVEALAVYDDGGQGGKVEGLAEVQADVGGAVLPAVKIGVRRRVI